MTDFGKLNWLDVLKALIASTVFVVLTSLQTSLGNTPPVMPSAEEWTKIGYTALYAAVSILITMLFTNSQGKFAREPKKEIPDTTSDNLNN